MVSVSGQKSIITWLIGAVALVSLFLLAPPWAMPFLIAAAASTIALESTRKLRLGQPTIINYGLMAIGVGLALASGLVWPFVPSLSIALLSTLALAIVVGRREYLMRPNMPTGMLPPALFARRAEEEMSRGLRFGRPAALLVVTLDRADDIRRVYGRRALQAALRQVTDTLVAQSRSYDLLTHLDSGRIALLLPEATRDEALQMAMRIGEAAGSLRFGRIDEGSPLPLAVNVGVAIHTEDGDAFQPLLNNAINQCRRVSAATATARPTEAVRGSARDMSSADASPAGVSVATRLTTWGVPVYIGLVVVGAILLFGLTFKPIPRSAWGLLVALGIVGVAARQLRIDLFGRGSASTGIIPIIAGGMLFGPTSAMALGVFAGLSTWRRGSKLYRHIFDGALYGIVAGLLALCQPTLDTLFRDVGVFHLALIIQGLILGVACYVINSVLLVGVMTLSEASNPIVIWRERFSWLLPHTVICGVLAAFMALAGSGLGPIGPLIFAIPAIMLQLVTKQYTERTRESVFALREAHTRLAATNEELRQSVVALEHSYTATLSAFSGMLDARDSETEGHSLRVVAYAVAIGKSLGLEPHEMAALEVGALLHDIGKVGVADAILRKNGPLTQEEWTEMRRHPEIGWSLTSKIPFLRDESLLVRHHHERWDGGGYPDQLRGEAIPLIARVFSVADSFDAMISDRPYRSGMTLEAAIAELRRGAGVQFDPQVVDAFLRMATDLEYLDTLRHIGIDEVPLPRPVLSHSH